MRSVRAREELRLGLAPRAAAAGNSCRWRSLRIPPLLVLALLPYRPLALDLAPESAPVFEADGGATSVEAPSKSRAAEPKSFLEVTYSPALQPLVKVTIGGQLLNLVFDASSANAVVFVKEYNACTPKTLDPCYSWEAADKAGGLRVCEENNDPQAAVCDTRANRVYACQGYLPGLNNASSHKDELIIDGLDYFQQGVEAVDQMSISLGAADAQTHSWSGVPLKLLVEPMSVPRQTPDVSVNLFEGSDGILGASGPTLSCRNTTLWSLLLEEVDVFFFAIDLRPPANATISDPGPSRIVLNELDPEFAPKLLWSEPKQTGDLINDGMHELLIYHPKVCGVDLLYNSSSNWLTVIDTSGPCLALPPFLFDRLMTHIPVDCPFAPGEKSLGRLCSPRRAGGSSISLPLLSFQLEDSREPEPPAISMALERLVFRNGSDAELLCVARQDMDTEFVPADMMYSHIALGSMVMAALYTVVDLQNHTIGLASRGDPLKESSEAFCAEPASCIAMQTFYPPLNLCEDPDCSEYMFMILDRKTKTCRWGAAIPSIFGMVLVSLVTLDLISHRLYKQAIQRASEFGQ